MLSDFHRYTRSNLEPEQVLILVLLDYALRPAVTEIDENQVWKVLILVLLDYALRLAGRI